MNLVDFGNSKMHILFVTGLFPNSDKEEYLGGMPKAVYKSARGMKNRGHEVHILATGSANKTWKYKGIPVTTICAPVDMKEKNTILLIKSILLREIQLQKAIKVMQREWKIDIIQYAGWFGIGLFHTKKIPAIMRISSYTKVQLVDIYSRTCEKCLHVLERFAVKRMNAVFAPSRVMARGVGTDAGRKVGMLETPFDEDCFDIDNTVWEKRLNSKQYILFFGRMSRDKGIYVIKEILHKVLDEFPRMSLAFAGNSTINNGIAIEKELREAAGDLANRVIFLGKLSPAELKPVIEHAEMVVMPSLMDNFPNACAEAMALGKIVIGTDGSSLEQFITTGYDGFLAKIGDGKSLYKQIQKVMMLSEEEKDLISAHAKERIAKLDSDTYFKRIERVYKKIIENTRHKRDYT